MDGPTPEPETGVERVEQQLRQNGGCVSQQELLLYGIRTPDLTLEERRLRNPAASAEEGVPPDMEQQREDELEPEQDGSLKSYLASQQQPQPLPPAPKSTIKKCREPRIQGE
eukprot:COSAG01_NODE_29277_length_641_cov_0.937269_1_plen_112_part_00